MSTVLPSIVAEIGGFGHFSWVFASYFLAQDGHHPIYGRLENLLGRKRVFFVGSCIFLIGSTACGLTRGIADRIPHSP